MKTVACDGDDASAAAIAIKIKVVFMKNPKEQIEHAEHFATIADLIESIPVAADTECTSGAFCGISTERYRRLKKAALRRLFKSNVGLAYAVTVLLRR